MDKAEFDLDSDVSSFVEITRSKSGKEIKTGATGCKMEFDIVPLKLGLKVKGPGLVLLYDKLNGELKKRRKRYMPLHDFSNVSNVRDATTNLKDRHTEFLERVPSVLIEKFIRIIQEVRKGAQVDAAVKQIDLEYGDYQEDAVVLSKENQSNISKSDSATANNVGSSNPKTPKHSAGDSKVTSKSQDKSPNNTPPLHMSGNSPNMTKLDPVFTCESLDNIVVDLLSAGADSSEHSEMPKTQSDKYPFCEAFIGSKDMPEESVDCVKEAENESQVKMDVASTSKQEDRHRGSSIKIVEDNLNIQKTQESDVNSDSDESDLDTDVEEELESDEEPGENRNAHFSERELKLCIMYKENKTFKPEFEEIIQVSAHDEKLHDTDKVKKDTDELELLNQINIEPALQSSDNINLKKDTKEYDRSLSLAERSEEMKSVHSDKVEHIEQLESKLDGDSKLDSVALALNSSQNSEASIQPVLSSISKPDDSSHNKIDSKLAAMFPISIETQPNTGEDLEKVQSEPGESDQGHNSEPEHSESHTKSKHHSTKDEVANRELNEVAFDGNANITTSQKQIQLNLDLDSDWSSDGSLQEPDPYPKPEDSEAYISDEHDKSKPMDLDLVQSDLIKKTIELESNTDFRPEENQPEPEPISKSEHFDADNSIRQDSEAINPEQSQPVLEIYVDEKKIQDPQADDIDLKSEPVEIIHSDSKSNPNSEPHTEDKHVFQIDSSEIIEGVPVIAASQEQKQVDFDLESVSEELEYQYPDTNQNDSNRDTIPENEKLPELKPADDTVANESEHSDILESKLDLPMSNSGAKPDKADSAMNMTEQQLNQQFDLDLPIVIDRDSELIDPIIQENKADQESSNMSKIERVNLVNFDHYFNKHSEVQEDDRSESDHSVVQENLFTLEPIILKNEANTSQNLSKLGTAPVHLDLYQDPSPPESVHSFGSDLNHSNAQNLTRALDNTVPNQSTVQNKESPDKDAFETITDLAFHPCQSAGITDDHDSDSSESEEHDDRQDSGLIDTKTNDANVNIENSQRLNQADQTDMQMQSVETLHDSELERNQANTHKDQSMDLFKIVEPVQIDSEQLETEQESCSDSTHSDVLESKLASLKIDEDEVDLAGITKNLEELQENFDSESEPEESDHEHHSEADATGIKQQSVSTNEANNSLLEEKPDQGQDATEEPDEYSFESDFESEESEHDDRPVSEHSNKVHETTKTGSKPSNSEIIETETTLVSNIGHIPVAARKPLDFDEYSEPRTDSEYQEEDEEESVPELSDLEIFNKKSEEPKESPKIQEHEENEVTPGGSADATIKSPVNEKLIKKTAMAFAGGREIKIDLDEDEDEELITKPISSKISKTFTDFELKLKDNKDSDAEEQDDFW